MTADTPHWARHCGQSVAVGRTPDLLRGTLCCAALLVLSGCSPLDQGAVTLDAGTERPSAVVPLCDQEIVRAVTLFRLDEDSRQPLWRIKGQSAEGETFTATAGTANSGFDEVIALSQPLLKADQFIMVTDTSGGTAADSEHVFELDQLEPGELYDGRIDSEHVSVSDLQSRADLNCGGPSEQWGALPLVVQVGAIGAVVGGMVFGVINLARRRRRAAPNGM